MNRCVFRSRAEADLEEIADYMAADSPLRALAYIRDVRARCNLLTTFPFSGRPRPEIGSRIRSRPMGNHVVYYVAMDDGVSIIRILHERRDVTPAMVA